MKRLRSILVLFLLFSTMFMANEKVDASAGRLKTASITSCNGTIYGEHAGHWHYAVKRGKYYYPNGSPVSKPCGKAKKKKSSGSSYSYNSEYSAKKAVANNKVTVDNKPTKDENDKEKDDIDKDVDTLKDQEETTPEVSNFTDNDEKSQNTTKEDEGSNLGVGFVAGLIGGATGSYLVRRHRSKKKKDDLTNW